MLKRARVGTAKKVRGKYIPQYHDYYIAPCTMTLDVIEDDDRQIAAVKSITLMWQDGYADRRDPIDYTPEMHKDKLGIYDLKRYILNMKKTLDLLPYSEYRSQPSRLICLVDDVAPYYHMLHKYVKCETFSKDGHTMMSCVMEDFLELRSIELITGSDIDDAFVLSKGNTYIEKCFNFCEIYYKDFCVMSDKHSTYKPRGGEKRVNDPFCYPAVCPCTISQAVKAEIMTEVTPADRQYIKTLLPEDEDSYDICTKYLFSGGMQAYNPKNCIAHDEEVGHNDSCSHYTAQLLTKKYPMTPWEECADLDLESGKYCYIIYAKVKGVKARAANRGLVHFDKDKIYKYENASFSKTNKLISADEIKTFFNDVDYRLFEMLYEYESIEYLCICRSKADYLPWYIREVAEKYYIEKCMYSKGDPRRALAKMKLEVMWGMLSQRLHTNDEIKYFFDEAIQYVKFSTYWGPWITAYARLELMTVSFMLGDDFMRCFTDSVMYTRPRVHELAIAAYNEAKHEEVQDYWRFVSVHQVWVEEDGIYMSTEQRKHRLGFVFNEPDLTSEVYELSQRLYDKMCELGSFTPEHDTYISDIEIKNAANLIYICDGEINTTIAGMGKHYEHEGKMINAVELTYVERENKKLTIFDIYQQNEFDDFIEQNIIKDDIDDFVTDEDGKQYYTECSIYVAQLWRSISFHKALKEAQLALDIKHELEKKSGRV